MIEKSRPLKRRVDGVEQHYNVGRSATSDADARFDRKAQTNGETGPADTAIIRQAEVRTRGWTREQVNELLTPHRIEVGARGPQESPYGFPLEIAERIEHDLGMGDALAEARSRREAADAAIERQLTLYSRPLGDFISHAALLREGWTDGLIKKHIGEPDRREDRDRGAAVRYYLRESVPPLPEKRVAAFETIAIPFAASDARAHAKAVRSKWQPESKTWAVPTKHADEVRALIASHEAAEAARQESERTAEREARAARDAEREAEREAERARVSVTIPYLATEIREQAKGMGARWQAASKTWSMERAAGESIEAAVAAWQAERAQRGIYEMTYSGDHWFGRAYDPLHVGEMTLVKHPDHGVLVAVNVENKRSQEYSDVSGESEWIPVTRVQTRALTDEERATYEAHLAAVADAEQKREAKWATVRDARTVRAAASVRVGRDEALAQSSGLTGVLIKGHRGGTTYDRYSTAYLTDDAILVCDYDADSGLVAPDFGEVWTKMPRTPETEAGVRSEAEYEAESDRLPGVYAADFVGDNY